MKDGNWLVLYGMVLATAAFFWWLGQKMVKSANPQAGKSSTALISFVMAMIGMVVAMFVLFGSGAAVLVAP